MSNQCDTCALRKGSAANLEINNYLKALFAVAGPIPFYCHSGQDWKAPEAHQKMSKTDFKARDFKVCAGWTAEVLLLVESGYYANQPTLTKAIAHAGLEALEMYQCTEGEDKVEARETLARLVEMIGMKIMAFRPETLDTSGLAEQARGFPV